MPQPRRWMRAYCFRKRLTHQLVYSSLTPSTRFSTGTVLVLLTPVRLDRMLPCETYIPNLRTTRELRTHFSFVRVVLAQRYPGGFFLKRHFSLRPSEIFFFCSSVKVLGRFSQDFFVVSLNFCLTSSVWLFG